MLLKKELITPLEYVSPNDAHLYRTFFWRVWCFKNIIHLYMYLPLRLYNIPSYSFKRKKLCKVQTCRILLKCFELITSLEYVSHTTHIYIEHTFDEYDASKNIIHLHMYFTITAIQHVFNGVARTLKKLRTSKGDYCTKQRFSTIMSLFKMGTSLKGKNLLTEGTSSLL